MEEAFLLFLLRLREQDAASSSATPGGAALRTDISGGSSTLRLNQGYTANEREVLGVADQILGSSGTADLAEKQADASISSSSSLWVDHVVHQVPEVPRSQFAQSFLVNGLIQACKVEVVETSHREHLPLDCVVEALCIDAQWVAILLAKTQPPG